MEKQIKINNVNWTVKEVPGNDANLIRDGRPRCGNHNIETQTIFISSDLTREKRLQVTRNEVARVVIYCYLLDGDQVEYTEDELCEFVAIYGEYISKLAREVYDYE